MRACGRVIMAPWESESQIVHSKQRIATTNKQQQYNAYVVFS